MTERVTMYQITKELLKEQYGNQFKHAEVRLRNGNNCNYLAKVLNSVCIDENMFKDGNSYSFSESSKETVKELINNHSVFASNMKKPLAKRDFQVVTQLVKEIETLLYHEISDLQRLQSSLAKVELTTYYRRCRLQKVHPDRNQYNFTGWLFLFSWLS